MPIWAAVAEENLYFGLRCCASYECLFLSTVYEENLDLDVYGTGIYMNACIMLHMLVAFFLHSV